MQKWSAKKPLQQQRLTKIKNHLYYKGISFIIKVFKEKVKVEKEIKKLVKKLFDSGMTLDQIIEEVSTIAVKEDFKRFKNEEC